MHLEKTIVLSLIIYCYSCSNEIKLDRKWLILKTTFENKEVYPKTIQSDKIEFFIM